MAKSVVVVGSANLDTVLGVPRIPSPGETVSATSQGQYAGGKGLNQAIAASRAGAHTQMIAALGQDAAGDQLYEVMAASSLQTAGVRRVAGPTGTAMIVVDDSAENSIVVFPGANAQLTALSTADRALIAASDVLLLQGEVPWATNVAAAECARAAHSRVVLNAAPAIPLDDRLLELVDVLIVNEYEARIVSGQDDDSRAAQELAARTPALIVTLGAAGSALYTHGTRVMVPAFTVQAVDTTGAGDTFCGAFGAALAEGMSLAGAVRFGSAAASCAVQTRGAVPSIPERAAIDAVLR